MIDVHEKFEGIWRVIWDDLPQRPTAKSILSLVFAEVTAHEVGFSWAYGAQSSTTWVTYDDGRAWLQNMGWANLGHIENLCVGNIRCCMFRDQASAVKLATILEQQAMWLQLGKAWQQ